VVEIVTPSTASKYLAALPLVICWARMTTMVATTPLNTFDPHRRAEPGVGHAERARPRAVAAGHGQGPVRAQDPGRARGEQAHDEQQGAGAAESGSLTTG
jgi:hypothetical protein